VFTKGIVVYVTEKGKEKERLIKKFSAQQKRIIEKFAFVSVSLKNPNAYQSNEQIC
jgi:hypothetical protein